MLLNKWISLGLNVLVAVFLVLSQVDWSSLLPAKYAAAGAFVTVVIKGVLNVLQPPPTQTIVPTGNSVVTHT